MTEFWSLSIVTLAVSTLLFCVWMLVRGTQSEEGESSHSGQADSGRTVDRIPGGWVLSFILGLTFAAVYLALYPGLGKMPGLMNWSSTGQYQREENRYQAIRERRFRRYYNMSVDQLASDPEARATGRHLFLVYCQNCHQMDGKGALHYPDLTGKSWLWGGGAAQIEETITRGRTGVMPGWGAVLSEVEVGALTGYVTVISGHVPADYSHIDLGKERFKQYCEFCHGEDGLGGPAVGAPNLLGKTWINVSARSAATNSGLEAGIRLVIVQGVTNSMPAHWDMLDVMRIKLLAGYVRSLSLNSNSSKQVAPSR